MQKSLKEAIFWDKGLRKGRLQAITIGKIKTSAYKLFPPKLA